MKTTKALFLVMALTALLYGNAWAIFSITLTPGVNTIPRTGGMVDFTMSVHSTVAATTDIWIGIQIPDGQSFYVYYMWLGQVFTAGQTINKHVLLYVSPMWMPGSYILPLNVGNYYTGQTEIQTSMAFTKTSVNAVAEPPAYPEGTIIVTDAGKTPALAILSVSPQPANPQVEVSYRVTEAGPVNVQLFNLQGSLMYESRAEASAAGTMNTILPTARFTSGQYFLRLEAGGTVVQRHLTILK